MPWRGGQRRSGNLRGEFVRKRSGVPSRREVPRAGARMLASARDFGFWASIVVGTIAPRIREHLELSP